MPHQRFANPDLAEEIGTLLDRYTADDDITWFLLRMVYQGGIDALAAKAKHFALTSRAKYTRIAAIRAVSAVGTPADAGDIRNAFLREGPGLSRDWLGELLADLPHDEAAIGWLLQTLEAAARMNEHQVDPLADPLGHLIDELPVAMLGGMMDGLVALLLREPVVEERHCEISKAYGWLAATAARVAVRLIEARDPAALAPSTLSALRLLPIASDYGRSHFEEIRKDLPDLVQGYARNAGLRIDHLLLSPALAERLVDAQVDREVRGWEKTSDHAPVWIELAEEAKPPAPARRKVKVRSASST